MTIQSHVANSINCILSYFDFPPFRQVISQISRYTSNRSKSIEHNSLRLKFMTPNSLCEFRANTFSTKEPETLSWIDGFHEGSVMWDIGANIGLYSCYAAKKNLTKVYAFEPSPFNLELLGKNIYINSLDNLITVIPLPLTKSMTESKLNLSSTENGGALSTFDVQYGHDGLPLDKLFSYPTIGLSLDDCLTVLNLRQPDYLKIDVDGIEHLILSGGKKLLVGVKGILIEVNDEFFEQRDAVKDILRECGFSLINKGRGIEELGSNIFGTTFNQIWSK